MTVFHPPRHRWTRWTDLKVFATAAPPVSRRGHLSKNGSEQRWLGRQPLQFIQNASMFSGTNTATTTFSPCYVRCVSRILLCQTSLRRCFSSDLSKSPTTVEVNSDFFDDQLNKFFYFNGKRPKYIKHLWFSTCPQVWILGQLLSHLHSRGEMPLCFWALEILEDLQTLQQFLEKKIDTLETKFRNRFLRKKVNVKNMIKKKNKLI